MKRTGLRSETGGRRRPPAPVVPHRRTGPGIWLTHHGRAGFTSLGRLWRQRGPSLATVAVVAIAIAFPSGLWLFVHDGAELAARFRGRARINVYLRTNLGGAQARALARGIAARPSVRAVRVLSRRESLAEFARWSGLGPHARDFFGPHPLPAVVVVTPKNTNPRAVRRLARGLSALPGVWQVHSDARWLAHLRLFLDLGERLVLTLGVLFALAALLVVANTIRLDVENARDEIQVLKMVGATDAFVRRPFLYRGAYYGLAGGAGAWLLVLAAGLVVAGPLSRLGRLYDSAFRLHVPGPAFAVALLLGGGVLGWLGAARAVRSELRRLEALL